MNRTLTKVEATVVTLLAVLVLVVMPLLNSAGVVSNFTINLWGQEGSFIDHRIKRLVDLVGAAVVLVLLAPLLLVIALLVAITSSGPVFYAQTRYGLDGRPFKMLKFRTMTVTEDGATPGLQ